MNSNSLLAACISMLAGRSVVERGYKMVIGEFAKITGISAYTLRYYEKKGLIRVGRDHAGRRDYSESDIEWVKFIQRLKNTGMLLRDIKQYSDLRYEGDATIKERMELLVQHRKAVVAERDKWDEYLRNLEEKIDIYQEKMKNSQSSTLHAQLHNEAGK